MGKAYARFFQAVTSIVLYFFPWSVAKQITGAGCVTKLPEIIKGEGIDNVLIVTDQNLRKIGLLDSLLKSLEEAGIRYTIFDDVKPNPTDRNVEEGLLFYKNNGCRGMIAFGGGSPIDCSKAIGARVARPNKTTTQMNGLCTVRRRIPKIFAVPTTAGSGSETAMSSLIIEEKTHHKAAIHDPLMIPPYAVLDPQLLVSLPPAVTSTTGMDALCHAVESYMNHTYCTKLEIDFALDAVRLIHENLVTSYENGNNLEARLNMQIAAFKAGRAFTRGGVGYTHAVGHALSGLYDIPHALAMAVILPHALRQDGSAAYFRLARLAEACGMEGADDAEKSEKFISWIDHINAKMAIPDKFKNLIKDEDIPQIIEWAMKEANPLYPTPVYWEKPDFERLIQTIRA